MRRVVSSILVLAVMCAAGFFGVYVWPTAYRYDQMNLDGWVLPVRIQRFSGKTEILYLNGWQNPDNQAPPEPVPKPIALPREELTKLQGNAFFSMGSLWCSVYNGSAYKINEITLHLQITDAGSNVPAIDRDYRMTKSYDTASLDTGTFDQYVGFTPAQNQKWSWYVKGARGVKQ
jgi:hypothetical protein